MLKLAYKKPGLYFQDPRTEAGASEVLGHPWLHRAKQSGAHETPALSPHTTNRQKRAGRGRRTEEVFSILVF